jgi:hypothetical protein
VAGENGAVAREESAVRLAVRRVGLALLVLDYFSLGFLLWRLEMPWYVAAPLGIAVGAFTTYSLQWRFLLSPSAFREAGSKARFVAAAAVIVAVNLGASSLLVFRYWYPYLAVRVLAASLGAWAWTRWHVVSRIAARRPEAAS